MVKRLGLVLLLCSFPAFAQDSPKIIALTEKSDIPTADIQKNIQKDCPSVSITNDASKSDYTLEAMKKSSFANGTEKIKFDMTLFDKDGTAVFSTSTWFVSNAVKDVCKAIKSVRK